MIPIRPIRATSLATINIQGPIPCELFGGLAVVLTGCGELLDAWAVHLRTLLGVKLLLPELRRNLPRVVAEVPSG